MNEEKPMRIGDQEREDAVARLAAHYEAGRLSADEHQERVGEALQAKTQGELAALFADLPGESAAGPKQASEGEQWAGPWGWARPPWTAPQDQGAAKAPRPARARGGRGPFARIPLPLLVLLGVIGVVASIGCVVGGGHPPVLPLVLVIAGVVIAKKRRQERSA